jgi:hypothetical protein
MSLLDLDCGKAIGRVGAGRTAVPTRIEYERRDLPGRRAADRIQSGTATRMGSKRRRHATSG